MRQELTNTSLPGERKRRALSIGKFTQPVSSTGDAPNPTPNSYPNSWRPIKCTVGQLPNKGGFPGGEEEEEEYVQRRVHFDALSRKISHTIHIRQ